jgi:hypothetical protein
MHSGRGDGPSRPPGYPIRKPPDHSLAAGSPGNIAGSSVLPRLLVPRHPPCALKNLAHKLTHTQRNPPTPRRSRETRELQVLDARVHCAVLKKQTAPPAIPRTRETRPWPARENPGTRKQRPFPQDPTACPAPSPRRPRPATPRTGKRTRQAAAGKTTE